MGMGKDAGIVLCGVAGRTGVRVPYRPPVVSMAKGCEVGSRGVASPRVKLEWGNMVSVGLRLDS